MPHTRPSVPGRTRHARLARWRKALLVLIVLGGAGGATLHFFGDTLVPPVVDAVRSVIGPAAMADLEAQYYAGVETTRQWQRTLGLAPPVVAPWAAPPVATAGPAPLAEAGTPPPNPAPEALAAPGAPVPLEGATPADPTDLLPAAVGTASGEPLSVAPVPGSPTPAPPLATDHPLPLRPILPDSALRGEGQWSTAALPALPSGAPPVFWKTFLRPDPARPDGLVYLVRFDPRRVRLHLVAGRKEPVSSVPGLGQVALADRPQLAAAFNGGFKSINGHYGMMVGGQVIAPPNPETDTATLAVYADGRVDLGAWQTIRTSPELVSYRQNCPLLIDQGAVVVQNHSGAAWGLTVLNAMYVWRSGLGRTADGSLIYAAGNRLSARELAQALQQAGAVEAMQLDINSAWVHWLNYARDGRGVLHLVPLVSGMIYHPNQYLTPGDRDFFYLTWP